MKKMNNLLISFEMPKFKVEKRLKDKFLIKDLKFQF